MKLTIYLMVSAIALASVSAVASTVFGGDLIIPGGGVFGGGSGSGPSGPSKLLINTGSILLIDTGSAFLIHN